ncbi:conserved hypothetical protein [Tenacibaculum litopenaei]|jgi:hypothetical protein|uniref:SdpI family protein n=1 Tax=Tenacibaculum litopenaei TaxID=396016 RepID=UPI0038934795
MNSYYYVASINGLLFILSVIFYYYPPKKVNTFYGYRTPKTTKNEKIWHFANAVFGQQFVRYASITLVAALILAALQFEISWQPMGLMLLTLGASVVKTEQELSKNFDEEGNKK